MESHQIDLTVPSSGSHLDAGHCAPNTSMNVRHSNRQVLGVVSSG